MHQIVIVVIVAISLAFVNGQTTAPYCPTGLYTGYQSTAFLSSRASGVSQLAGVTYSSGGFYSARSAEECCYNCRTQTNGACTTWTYFGCGRCFLSSAT